MNAECDTLALRIRDLAVAPATCNRELGVVMRAVQVSKVHVAPGEDKASVPEAWVR